MLIESNILLKKLEKQREYIKEQLAGGNAKDFNEYRYLCGMSKGVENSLSSLEATLKEMYDSE